MFLSGVSRYYRTLNISELTLSGTKRKFRGNQGSLTEAGTLQAEEHRELQMETECRWKKGVTGALFDGTVIKNKTKQG